MSAAPGPSKPTLNPYQSLPNNRGKNERFIFSSEHPFTPTFVHSHLKKSRNLDAKALYDSRVKGRQVLLENPVRARKAKGRPSKLDEKARLKAARIIGKPLKGQWVMDKYRRRYDLYLPLHHLWLSYMSELLSLAPLPITVPNETSMPSSAAMHAKLVKTDFHGSIISVKQAKNHCLIGLTGIVLLDRENSFLIATEKNEFKTLPKRNSVLTFSIPLYDVRSLLPSPTPQAGHEQTTLSTPSSSPFTLNTVPRMEFELYGNQFCFRTSDRASKKFKSKESIEL